MKRPEFPASYLRDAWYHLNGISHAVFQVRQSRAAKVDSKVARWCDETDAAIKSMQAQLRKGGR